MDQLKDLLLKRKDEIKRKIGDKRTYKCTDLMEFPNMEEPKKKRQNDFEVPVTEIKSTNPIKENETILSRAEVIRILRKRSEPVRCFGETDYDAYQRMKLIQLIEPKHRGLANDFKAAMEKVDEDEAVESYRQRADGHGTLEVSVKSGMENLDNRQLRKMRRYLSSYCLSRESVTSVNREFYNVSTKDDPDGNTDIDEFNKDSDDEMILVERVCDFVLNYLKYLLAVWGRELNARPKWEKGKYKGKEEGAQYNQTIEYIKPLFRLFKERSMSLDILDSMVKITALLLDRNYLKANEAYLELAIGNAPWPLGVTNHGIHARTAQEKIHAKNVAHVLNDETQRKYIQAVKRLITRNQSYFPTDPKRSVNYPGKFN